MKIERNAFHVDWNKSPEEVVRTVTGHAEIIQTLFEGGVMTWHCWNGPKNELPLILLHGGWGSWTHWLRVIPSLVTRSSVFAADLPGMGNSTDIDPQVSIEVISSIVMSGIDQLLFKGNRYDLSGFSFGAVVGGGVAALDGYRCRSLTAVGAAGCGNLHHVVGGVRLPDAHLSSDEINAIHKNNLSLLMLAKEQSIDELAIYLHRMNIEQGRFRSRRISFGSSFIDVLSEIKSHIGGIWGEWDSTGGSIRAIEERRKIFEMYQPHCPFDIIKGGGHWVMYEKPAEFVSSIFRHLDQHQIADTKSFVGRKN